MKDRILKVKWSKKENDLMITYPRRCDGALIHYLFSDILRWAGIEGKDKGWLNYETFNFLKELKERGYDLTTLKFEVRLRDDAKI
jgi:hypothetical protein